MLVMQSRYVEADAELRRRAPARRRNELGKAQRLARQYFNCIEAEQLSTYRAAAAVDAGHHHEDLSVLLDAHL